MGSYGERVVMNRQKHFEVDPFLCFRKGNVVRKGCEESAESETRGAVFMNIVENTMPSRKKKRRLWW